MPICKLPYGSSSINVSVDEKNLLYYAAPVVTDDIPDRRKVIDEAFANPYNSKRLEEMVRPGMRIAVMVDDATRPTPKKLLLPEILKRLESAGASRSDITIILALGTHRLMTDEEIDEYIGFENIKGCALLNIDYKDQSRFVDLGKTENGTPIEVYREVVEADFKIALGNVVPHVAAGWGGGGKMIQPGVCSERTTEVTHLMACLIQDVLKACGTVDNPCRKEIEMIAGKVGLDFIVNTVMDENKNILGLFTGHFIDAHRAAVALATQVLRPAIPAKADIVIASANPANVDFWQGAKPYIFSHFGVRDGGVIIFVMSADEGLCGGAPHHLKTLEKYCSLDFETIKKDLDDGKLTDIVGINIPLFVSTLRSRATTICVSHNLTAEDAAKLSFDYAPTAQQALEKAYKLTSPDAKVGVIPYGGETLVRVQE